MRDPGNDRGRPRERTATKLSGEDTHSLERAAATTERQRRERLYRDLRRVGTELEVLHPEASALAFAWAEEVAA